MLFYEPLSYFVFLTAAVVLAGFAIAFTGRTATSTPRSLRRWGRMTSAAATWVLSFALLIAPFFGAAKWLAERVGIDG